MKQFTSDEMGTTRKGRSHLCFISANNFLMITLHQNTNSYQHLREITTNNLFLTVRCIAPHRIYILIHSKGFNYDTIYPFACTQSIFNP